MDSNDFTAGAYMAPPVTALYMVAPVDDSGWEPGKLTVTEMPNPEEMKRIALESTVIADLVKRVRELEERVRELENDASD